MYLVQATLYSEQRDKLMISVTEKETLSKLHKQTNMLWYFLKITGSSHHDGITHIFLRAGTKIFHVTVKLSNLTLT